MKNKILKTLSKLGIFNSKILEDELVNNFSKDKDKNNIIKKTKLKPGTTNGW